MKISTKLVVLVTGASSGMGNDTAMRLLKEGHVVYGAARRTDRMQEIVEAGGVALTLDLTSERSMLDAIDRIISEHGRIDVLINAAGYGQYGAIEDVPLELARKQMEVNLFGLARLTQLCLPYMRQHRFGRIINISSIGGKITTPLGGWYHASKFALEGWSDTLRNEVQEFGIDVVVIEPGGIQSEWSGIAIDEARQISSNGPYSKLVQAFVRAQSSMGRAPQPTVIGKLVSHAVSSARPRTRYVGGMLAKPMLFLRRWLPDRIFDRLVMSAFR